MRDGGATETAVIVPVPAAEPVIGKYRQGLDRSAVWGVPAHVTVLYPFVRPDEITAATVDRIRAAVAGIAPFGCRFGEIRWFGQDAVWLAPDPGGPFRAMTAAVWQEFPDHPPYQGAFPDVIPHLTIGSTRRGDLAGMTRAASEIAPELPIDALVDHLLLIAGTDAPDSWQTVSRIELRTDPVAPIR